MTPEMKPAAPSVAAADVAYVFLSHARADRAYVEQLASYLISAGVPTWYDRQLDAGQQWPEVIRSRIAAASAVIVVVSEVSKVSRWVQRELLLAERLDKPIFPVQLASEPWWRLSDLESAQVKHRRMPEPAFAQQIKALIERAPSRAPLVLPRNGRELARHLATGDLDVADRLAADMIRAAVGGQAITSIAVARRVPGDLLRLLIWMYRSAGGVELRERPFVIKTNYGQNGDGSHVDVAIGGRSVLAVRLDEVGDDEGAPPDR
jgi:hypothetical protein